RVRLFRYTQAPFFPMLCSMCGRTTRWPRLRQPSRGKLGPVSLPVEVPGSAQVALRDCREPRHQQVQAELEPLVTVSGGHLPPDPDDVGEDIGGELTEDRGE